MWARGKRSRSANRSGVVQTRSPMLSRRITRIRGWAALFPVAEDGLRFMCVCKCRPRHGSTGRSQASDVAIPRKEIEQSLAERFSCPYVEPLREELQQFERPVAVELARDPAHALEHPRLKGRKDIVLGPLDVDLDELRRRCRAVLDDRARSAHVHRLPLLLGRPGVVERISAEVEGRIRASDLEPSFLRPQGEAVRPDPAESLDVAYDHRLVFRNRLEAMNLGPGKAAGKIERSRADVGADIPHAARAELFRDVVLRLDSPPQQDLVNHLRIAAAGAVMQPAAPPAEAGYRAGDVA